MEEELKTAALLAELDNLDVLQEEHQRFLVREQKLVEEEKVRVHDWIADLKSGFELKKWNFRDKISQLEEKLKKTPKSKPADPARTTVHVPLPDSSGERSMGRTSTSTTTPSAPTPPINSTVDSSRGATDSLSMDTGTSGGSGAVTDATGSDTLVKSMAELIKAQMQAMTKAASVHW